jgi:hypothetical protein
MYRKRRAAVRLGDRECHRSEVVALVLSAMLRVTRYDMAAIREVMVVARGGGRLLVERGRSGMMIWVLVLSERLDTDILCRSSEFGDFGLLLP